MNVEASIASLKVYNPARPSEMVADVSLTAPEHLPALVDRARTAQRL